MRAALGLCALHVLCKVEADHGILVLIRVLGLWPDCEASNQMGEENLGILEEKISGESSMNEGRPCVLKRMSR